MQAQKCMVRWCFLATCVFISLSFVWMVKKRGRPSKWKQLKLDKDAALSLPLRPASKIPSTRSAMIEKQLGRPLEVDPDMPYIGYLKPEEWRKYNLPEGIGIGRGSKGKQRNKFGQKKKIPQVKTKQGQGRADIDPNQLFFNIELDDEVEANIVAEENIGQLENIDEEEEEWEDGEEEEDEEDEEEVDEENGGWDGS